MSMYRNLLVGFAAVALAMPVLANHTPSHSDEQSAQPANSIELTENGVATPSDATMKADDAKSTADSAKSTADSATQDAMTADGKVNLNKATVNDLMKVKGMNAAKAKAIVAYRKKHGDFKSVEDLKDVKGFKKMKADEMTKMTEQLAI